MSRSELPSHAHVVIANELLDNVPFDLAVHDGGWRLAQVDRDGERFVELLGGAASIAAVGRHGARAPVQRAAHDWVMAARSTGARVVVFDYTSTTGSMAARPWREWLRTYRHHDRGRHYLLDAGLQDITTEVAVDQLPEPDAVRTQAQWLAFYGIDELVAEGRRIWNESASVGDLRALAARSRIAEAEALTDPAGLGSFTVMEWYPTA